jgi:hypothetical protein
MAWSSSGYGREIVVCGMTLRSRFGKDKIRASRNSP